MLRAVGIFLVLAKTGKPRIIRFMWNCERIRSDGQAEQLEDVIIEFQAGSEPDRFGPSQCDIAHLKAQSGELLGSLALGMIPNVIKMHSDGFEIHGALVNTAPNGHVTEYHRVGESWKLTVVPDSE